MNHRRIRNLFIALAVFGIAAAGAASAYANMYCGHDWCFGP